MKLQNMPANPVTDRASETAQRHGGRRMESKGPEGTFRLRGCLPWDRREGSAGADVEKN